MRLTPCLLAGLIATAICIPVATAQDGPDGGDEAVVDGTAEFEEALEQEPQTADIPFAGDETKTYRGVLVQVEFWFPLPEQWELTSDALLELHFNHSPVLIERLSAITANVNGNGVDSVFLNVQNARNGKVVWSVDPAYFKLGESNKIEIVAKMRSDLELCDDVHSPALWMSIQKESRLTIQYREKPVTKDVSGFPQTYMRPALSYERGTDTEKKTHAIIVVPTDAGPEVLNGIGVVSARIGVGSRFPRGMLEVTAVGEITEDVRSRLREQNIIVIGPLDFVSNFVSEGLDVGNSLANANGNGQGYVVEARNPWNPSRRALVVTGADGQALSKAVTALSMPHLSEHWAPKEGEPPRRAVSFDTRPELPDPSEAGKTGTQTISLADLGSSDRTERGKFHHYLRLAFPNPFVGRVKSPAFIRLIMSYSELLVPQTSSLLVKLNRQPIRSVRLAPRTARKLEADIIIPDEALTDRVLLLDLEFFLDIGDPDCHYNFPEMAWVTVYNTSFIAYPLEEAATASLRSYPWVAAKEPNLNGTVFVVSDMPTDESLTAVANIAAFLGKSLPRVRDAQGRMSTQWVHPWVKRVSQLDAADQNGRDIIVVGDYGLVRSNSSIQSSVAESLFTAWDAPEGIDKFSESEYRADGGWIHLGPSPWNPRRNLIVVSGANGDAAAAEAGEYLWVQRKVDRLGGAGVIVGSNGTMQVLIPAPGEEPQKAPAQSLTPRVPLAEADDGGAASTLPLANGQNGAHGQTGPAAAPEAKHQVAYLVFVILGLLLVVLVVVRIRDAMRTDAVS